LATEEVFMKKHTFIHLVLLFMVAYGYLLSSAQAADTAGLSLDIWQRVHAVEPAKVDLKPTPSPSAPAALSLREAIALAARHSADFRQNQQQLADARQRLWVADQKLYYTATGSGQREKAPGGDVADTFSARLGTTWQMSDGSALRSDVGTGTQEEFGTLFSNQPSLSLSYDRPLLRGAGLASSTSERIRSARTSLASQELSFYDSYQSLAQTIINDYCAILLASGQLEIAKRAVERAQKLYDINYAKFSGEGLVKPGETWISQVAELDVNQSRLSLEQAKQTQISSEQNYRDALDSLLLDMGFTPGATPQLTTAISYSPDKYDEAALIKEALSNSTQLGQLDLNRQNADAALRIARSQYRPDVTASVGINDLGETVGGVSTSNGWFTGIRVDVPIRDRSRQADVDQNGRALDVLQQRIIAARDSVTQEVQRQVRAALSSQARIGIGEQAVALAQKNREAAQGMYDEGLNDYLRVLDADDRLVSAERSLLQEKIQYFLTTIRLQRAVSADITKDLPE
jgi:outer membrane protein TolC